MYLAQSGLSSAQAAMNVIGNNLNNAMTPGYSRENIILGESGGKTTNTGYFGYGAEVDGVQRAYDGFVNTQLRSATTENMGQSSRYEQFSQIDNMLGDDSNNISVSLNSVFKALEMVSSKPADPAARQGAFAQFQATVYHFNANSNTLDGLEKSTNTLITQNVADINADAKQLAKLNDEIGKIHGRTGDLPADLLDQRDQLLSRLSEKVGIKVNENTDNGRVDITLSNGMPLVNGNRSYLLDASPSAQDPSKTVVSYVDASGNKMPFDETRMTNGALGGLFKFRNEDLTDARNQLNQLALQMANKFNEVNAAGLDPKGQAGEKIFNIADPVALANRENTGNGALNVTFTDASKAQSENYTLTFKGPGKTDWDVQTKDGKAITPTVGVNGELEFDGLSVKPQGTPQVGDNFTMNPVSGAAGKLSMKIASGEQIAAAGQTGGQSNNENIKDMLAIKNTRLIGNGTLIEAYSILVSSVGSSMTALKEDLSTSAKACESLVQQQQGIIGVDINEESINLQMYTQFYQANAQVLQTANTLFDALLNIR